jgi:AraC-like DNA-binding protein
MSDAQYMENGCKQKLSEVGTADSVQFCSIEEMQATADAQGWSATYRQLQAGKLLAGSYAGACGDITLADEFVSRQIEVVGTTPDAHITVVAPISSARVWMNGRSFDKHGVLCFPAGAEMHGVPSENHRILSMHVPITLLQTAGLDTCDAWTRLIGGESAYVEPDGATGAALKRLMYAAIHEPLPASERPDRASELLMRISSVVCAPIESQSYSRRDSVAETYRVIDRSREYIEAHLFESIPLGEVCTYAAASLSKLERIFQRELQMSPSQYILKRRLIAVNDMLKQTGSCSTPISKVAMDYGFNHLGRFAGTYRDFFGELPSDTLRLI